MNKKKISLILSVLLVVGGGTGYAATSKTVQATYKTFKYAVEGYGIQSVTKEQPVVINGQVYIPVNAVKEALKTNVTVDNKSATINFGEKREETPITKEPIRYAYGSGLTQDSSSVRNEKVIRLIGSVNSITLNPNGKYQKLALDVRALDAETTIEFKDGDTHQQISKELLSKEIGGTQVEVNIAGVKKLEIHAETVYSTQNSDTIIYPSSHYK